MQDLYFRMYAYLATKYATILREATLRLFFAQLPTSLQASNNYFFIFTTDAYLRDRPYGASGYLRDRPYGASAYLRDRPYGAHPWMMQEWIL